MAQCLQKKFEKKPDLPGSDIVPILLERIKNRSEWTEEEKAKLKEGIIKYGKDVQKLSLLLPTKKPEAIRFKVQTMVKNLSKTSNLDDLGKALTVEEHICGSISWTKEETSSLI